MKYKTKTNLWLVIFVFAFVTIFSVFFVGCDNKNYTYEDSKQVYAKMLSDNSEFFDENGIISITYNSTNLNAAILSGQKNNNFTKLSNSLSDSEAVYEPTLRASLMLVSTFLPNSSDTGVNIDQAKLNNLYSSVNEVSDAMHLLKQAKQQLENTCSNVDFSQSTSAEQLKLKTYCSRFIYVIDKACNLSNVFVDIYKNDIYKIESNIREGALSSTTVNLEYLTKIADIASYYNNFYLYDINEKVKKGPQNAGLEIDIDNEFDWTIIEEFEQIKSKKKAGNFGDPISAAEQEVIDAYNQIIAYDNVFYANKNSALQSVELYRAIANSSEMSLEEQICTNKIAEFAIDCKIVKNYFTILTEKINAFNV